jgi:hypothetical protein
VEEAKEEPTEEKKDEKKDTKKGDEVTYCADCIRNLCDVCHSGALRAPARRAAMKCVSMELAVSACVPRCHPISVTFECVVASLGTLL